MLLWNTRETGDIKDHLYPVHLKIAAFKFERLEVIAFYGVFGKA